MGFTQRCGSYVSEKKKMVSKCSSSSSISRRNVCGCGERTMLFTSNTVFNPGWTFWRCPNWNVSSTSFCVVGTAYSPQRPTSSHFDSSLFAEERVV
ncbi:hypothetical protein SESBI_01969 [Sesbania bispinosa]|nr:hypothetical protein SESBI_01969 [Sesbania bispinosa]